jgi:hypothetical protein
MAIQSPTPRRTKKRRSPRLGREPWLSVVLAIVAAILIVGGESWAIRQATPFDGSISPTLASDLNRALANVAETSLLIGPVD